MVFTVILGALSAQATPLESAEFYNTAHTLDKGAKVIHPLFPSTFGVSDGVNLETTFLGWFGGPNIATEIGFVNTDSMAVSAKAIFSSAWDFSAFSSVGGQLNYTSGGPLTNRFNASGGVIQNSFAGYNSFSIPLALAMILCRVKARPFNYGASDISYLEGGAAGSIGAAWNKGGILSNTLGCQCRILECR